MTYGFHNKIIRINLSNGCITFDEPGENFFRRYLGGRGVIGYYLLNELEAGIDPLSPENKLIFTASVITGAKIPGAGRHSVGAKSPLTGFYGESESGGFWGPELKSAGYDGIILEGRAEKPVYLFIKDDRIELKDASHLWGQTVLETNDMLIEETGEAKLKTLIIGPAGENLVKFAGIAHDLSHYHGRTGMGAVMGSKNIKAVVVRGTGRQEFFNQDKLKEIFRYFTENFQNNNDNKNQHQHGTSDYYFGSQAAGTLPTYNYRKGYFEKLEYDADELHAALKKKTEGCYACPLRCKQVFEAEKPYKINGRLGGPEFETLGAFGSICGISDMYAAPKAHEICNQLGIDTVSAGVTIAFAMECYERGLISKEDTDGIELEFGNVEAMFSMLKKIAYRDGFGNILAEGSKKAGKIIGKGAEKYSMQVKGQEFAVAEPRAKFGVGLAYAVSPTGADHLQHEHDGAFDSALTGYSHTADDPHSMLKTLYSLGWYDPVPSLSLGFEKVALFTHLQHYWSLFNMLDICIFTFQPVRTLKITHIPEIVKAVTGWDTSLMELIEAGRRGTTMARLFNLKHGMTKEDDLNIPDRMFEGLQEGPLNGSKLDREEFEKAVSSYYEMMGWDSEEGIPLESTVHYLGIPWAAKILSELKAC